MQTETTQHEALNFLVSRAAITCADRRPLGDDAYGSDPILPPSSDAYASEWDVGEITRIDLAPAPGPCERCDDKGTVYVEMEDDAASYAFPCPGCQAEDARDAGLPEANQ